MTLFVVAPDESLTNGWKLLEQGPESQSDSGVCSGGVSAVMGSSDLDALTLVRDATDGNQLSCSLPFRPYPSDVGFDLLHQADREKGFGDHGVPPSRSHGTYLEGVFGHI